MIGRPLAAVGLALQVAGTLLISIDAFLSQRETRKTLGFLDYVTHLESNLPGFVKVEDLQEEIGVAMIRMSQTSSGEELRQLLLNHDQLTDGLSVVRNAQIEAANRSRDLLEKTSSKIDRSSRRREFFVVPAVFLVFVGGILEYLGTFVVE